ncbi:MAG TPA: Asp-tRNA(Asn)/Glu-tRNA(Gln) amidotransferase subunit GatC [Gammaproteobacteria bacterium]|nr:Asp-tRNA(Asn)/Glu-tRNA(Gln) amidotransferase subunit GatC [Gammaproteobacteria bacterium]
MSFKADDVQAVAHLARLAIDDSRVPDYARDLSRILDLVEQMNQVDTEKVDPLAHPLEMAQRMRDDDPRESVDREAYQAVAPEVRDGLYIVPRVVE